MFVPEMYDVGDLGLLRQLIDGYPLATVLSNGPVVPHATQVPVILPERERAAGTLVGAELSCHMNRQNPHWAALADGASVKLVFQGPSSYVSPCAYGTEVAAPTWNFVTVHLLGVVRLARDPAETLRVVTATANALESRFGAGFDFGRSIEYFCGIAPGVGAFFVTVESVEAMFKLSQEKDSETRRRVIERFDDSEAGTDRELAAMMRRFTSWR